MEYSLDENNRPYICSNCHEPLERGTLRCPYCSIFQRPFKFCSTCQEPLDALATYCPKCLTPFKVEFTDTTEWQTCQCGNQIDARLFTCPKCCTLQKRGFCLSCGWEVSYVLDHCWHCNAELHDEDMEYSLDYNNRPSICMYCHESIEVGALRCPYCSNFQRSAKLCTYCQQFIDESHTVCDYCGAHLD